MHFNELQMDALREIFNISISQAAATLSEVVQQPVSMTVPGVDICNIAKAIYILNQGYDICGISQCFSSEFSGKAILLFPEHRSLELVQLMVGVDTPLERVTELEQDALLEIGNLVINACLSSLSSMLNQRFEFDIPKLVFGSSNVVLSDYDESNMLILLQIKFVLEQRELEGSIVFVVNMQSMLALQKSVSVFIQDLDYASSQELKIL